MSVKNESLFMDETITSVECAFVDSKDNPGKLYKFVVKKKLAQKLSAGDLVLANAVNGIKIVAVQVVHPETRIDYESDINYQWVFQKVNIEKLIDLQESQKESEEVLQTLNNIRQRAELHEKYMPLAAA